MVKMTRGKVVFSMTKDMKSLVKDTGLELTTNRKRGVEKLVRQTVIHQAKLGTQILRL